MENNIFFEKISGTHKQKKLLFELLKKRKYKISHNKLPSFEKHITFVNNHPYKVWYLVIENDKPIGAFYIKADNSIGLNLLIQTEIVIKSIINFIKMNYLPTNKVASKIPPYFYINVPSKNIELMEILDKRKIKRIQISYQL